MSFLAKLEIDGETMNVLEFNCSIRQETDKNGKPAADPNAGNVRLLVESTKSTLLFDWMISHSQTKNGKITFFRRDAVSNMREFEFNEAYCVGYDEMFMSDNNSPMQIQFTFSAKEIIMNGSKLTRNWPLKF